MLIEAASNRRFLISSISLWALGKRSSLGGMSKRRQESVKAAAKLVKVKVEGVEECGGPMDCVIGSDSHPAIAWAGFKYA